MPVLERIRAWITDASDSRRVRWHVSVTPEGCVAERRHGGSAERWSVRWADVSSATAFKTDDLTFDTIWISLESNAGEPVLFPDDAEGFSEAARSLPDHLAGCLAYDEWFSEVAHPAFERRETSLYLAAV